MSGSRRRARASTSCWGILAQYESSSESGANLCRIKTDGINNQVLYEGGSSGICIIDDWIYLRLTGDYGGEVIYRIKKDGSQGQLVLDENTEFNDMTINVSPDTDWNDSASDSPSAPQNDASSSGEIANNNDLIESSSIDL